MAFIRRRGTSHQIIETYREGSKVHQRVLANLGEATSIEERLMVLLKAAAGTRRLLNKHERCIAAWTPEQLDQRIQFGRVPDLSRKRARLDRLIAEIEKLVSLRSVKLFSADRKLPDTTSDREPSAADRLIQEMAQKLLAEPMP
jgi:hypothetical protein